MSSFVVSSSSWKEAPQMVAADSLLSSATFSRPRASFSFGSSSASTSRTDASVDSLVRRRFWRCACGIHRRMGRAVENSRERGLGGVTMSAALVPGEEVGHCSSFFKARSEEDLLSYIRKKVDSGRLSSDIGSRLEELYHNYQNAVMQSGDPRARQIALTNMAIAFDRILSDLEDPFRFAPYHKAIRKPFDYYKFGQNYFRPLIDFRRSYIGNISLFFDMELKLQQVEQQIGEKRKISFHGIGLSVAPQVNFNEITVGCGNLEEAKEAFSLALYDSVIEQYNVLKFAIYGYQGLNVSNSIISLSQPWL